MASPSFTPSSERTGNAINPLKRPAESNMVRIVKIKVTCQLAKDVHIKIKSNIAIRGLINKYFQEVPHLDPRTVRVLYDGKRIALNHTPDQIGMSDEDELNVMAEVYGGGFKVAQANLMLLARH